MKNYIENAFEKHIRVIRELEPGGQKSVYVINSNSYGNTILKLINNIKGDNLERVKREIDIITNNNIKFSPKVFENGEIVINGDSYIYIIEEFIDGGSLKNVLLKKKKLSLEESYYLLERLLCIISQLEKIGIVHRDIKPDNIIINKNNEAYLIDFGIARALKMDSLTLTIAKFGPHTPGYAAPEIFQNNKKNIDSRADLFSIGVVVFESITGKHPFIDGSEESIFEIWNKTITILPEDIVVEGDTQQQFISLIKTLMMHQMSKRPPSAQKAYEWLIAIKDTLIFGGK